MRKRDENGSHYRKPLKEKEKKIVELSKMVVSGLHQEW